ncbi:MAG: CarD family transcriptional regulator [Proteobacteria bacterium]|nr:CarD family transcriptional regulator [Pseudomonadota bacterium]
MAAKNFKVGEHVVYPAHGVGKLIGCESHNIAGTQLELLVINFDKDKMVLRLPKEKAENAGLRPLSSKTEMDDALKMLSVRTKPRRVMWSRRAQEYETKINSGMPGAIAEVIRDLYRRSNDNEQSYSERQIYQAAVERFVRELSAVEDLDEKDAIEKMEVSLRAA